MAETVNFNMRIDKALRDETNAIFENYGMTTAQAFRMFLVNVANTKKVPLTFEFQAENTHALTPKAQARLKQSEQEFVNGDYTTCTSLDELSEAMEQAYHG